MHGYDENLLLQELKNILEQKISKVHKIVCLSHYILESLPDHAREKSSVVYPIFNYKKYHGLNQAKKTNILFVNPIKPKGVETMIDIVDHFRDEQFEILEGWYPIERHYKEKIEKYSNVTITKHSNDMRKIYDRTKFYLCHLFVMKGLEES